MVAHARRRKAAFPKLRSLEVERAFADASRMLFDSVLRQTAPLLAQIRAQEVPEGGTLVQHTDGGQRSVDMQEVRSRFTVSGRVVRETRVDEFVEALTASAREMIGQQAGMLFRSLSEVTAETGHTRAVRGEVGLDDFVALISSMEVDFSSGRPDLTAVCSPEMGRRLERLQQQWMADPAKRERLEALWQAKHEQWVDRERARKLVD